MALPLLVVIGSGILLLLKKELAWIQPPTQKGSVQAPAPGVGFETILRAASSVAEAVIADWSDVERLDVRPAKGIVKVQAKNDWELQVDLGTGEVLQAAYRRSDWIEAIHDGSFFHPAVKTWVFLPSAVVLLGMWATGIYLFLLPFGARRRARRRGSGGDGRFSAS